ncbi:MAG: D-alanine--D-alanine ligase family protein [Acidimicrobiales bacterium]
MTFLTTTLDSFERKGGVVKNGVLMGGPSPEHDISILTGLQALRELERAGDEPVGIYWSKSGSFYSLVGGVEAEAFFDGVPRGSNELSLRVGDGGGFYHSGGRRGRERPLELDVLVLATHGGPGEDGTLQATLDLAGVSYTGPSVASAALGMDKWSFATLVASAGLPTLPRALLGTETAALPFDGPYILKPRFGGSSIGIDVVADLATARARLSTNPHLVGGCVVEPFRADLTDLQIAVRTFPSLSLSAVERPLRRSVDAEILNYRDKYVGGEGMVSAPRELPAALTSRQHDDLISFASRVAVIASVRGVARVDFLASEHELYVNEINTIPGSLAKYLFIDPPLDFVNLLRDMMREARERPTHRYSAAGADGLVLRSAGSIAAKLA